jgi:hypothetical protein
MIVKLTCIANGRVSIEKAYPYTGGAGLCFRHAFLPSVPTAYRVGDPFCQLD